MLDPPQTSFKLSYSAPIQICRSMWPFPADSQCGTFMITELKLRTQAIIQ